MGRRNVAQHIYACLFVVLIGSLQGGSSQTSGDVEREGRVSQSSVGVRDIEGTGEILTNNNHLLCPIPQPPENGFLVGEVIRVGAVMHLRCRDGYKLTGPAEMVCVETKDGAQWNADLTQSCVDLLCPIPQPPENGFLVGEVIRVGAVMHLRCRDGYKLTGPEEMVCVETKDGAQWNADLTLSCFANNSSQPSLSTASLDTTQGTEPKHLEKKQVISPPSINVYSHLSDQRRQLHPPENVIKEELNEPSRESTNKLPALCLYKPDAGPCDASIRRYYFKASTRECYKFIYGGCEGNTNNFATMADCNLACLGHG